MKGLKCILMSIALSMCLPALAHPAVPAWETVETFMPGSADSEKVEATVREGYIYVSCPMPTTVKILSILGQQISQAKLPAGTSRIKIAARGIYILKAGDTTIRVTI